MVQIGVRWRAGDKPHPTVPEALHDALEQLSSELSDPVEHWWTMTWLEGKPWCDLDDGTRVTLSHEGTARIILPHEMTPYDGASEEDDDWLEGK